ncbi:MAG: ArnT family glycosyltransferase [bacterium]
MGLLRDPLVIAKFKIPLVAILVLLPLMQLLYPGADPPSDLSWSRAPFTDEGFKAYNARNRVLFGSWKIADYDEYPGWHIQSPLFSFLLYISFSLFGVGFIQARAVALIFGILSPIILALILSLNDRRREALIAYFLLGSGYTYLMYARLSLLEIPMNFFIALSLLLLAMGERRKIFLIPSLSSFACAYLIKPTAAAYVPTLILGSICVLGGKGIRLDGKKGTILAAVALSFVGIMLLPLLLERQQLEDYIGKRFALSCGDLGWSILAFFRSRFFARMPVLALLSAIGLGTTIYRWREAKFIDKLMAVWLLNNALFLMVLNYKPPRYFLPLLPSMCALAALLITRLYDSHWSATWRRARFFALGGIFALNLAVDFGQYLKWAVNRSYNLIESSRSLNEIINDGGATIGGSFSPTLCMETPFKCFTTNEGANLSEEAFLKFKPDYMIYEEVKSEKEIEVREMYGDRIERFELLRTFELGRHKVNLYRIDWK